MPVYEADRQHNEGESDVEEKNILHEEEATPVTTIPTVPVRCLITCTEEEIALRRMWDLLAEGVEETGKDASHDE